MLGLFGRRISALIAVMTLLSGCAGSDGDAVDTPVETPPEVHPASVATFGVHALISAGLQERHAVFYQYTGVETDETGWAVLVAGGAHGLHVSLEDSDLVVDDYAGFTRVEGVGEKLVGFREPIPEPEPGYEFFNIDLVKQSKIKDRPEGPLLESSFFWTGPIPSDVFFTCHAEITDADGEVLHTGKPFERDPPLSELARTGGLYYEKIPKEALDGTGEVICEPKE